MKIVIATNNPHKVREYSRMLTEPWIQLIPFSHKIPKDVESGNTFYENALKKALFGLEKTSLPVLAEDSGLVVPALNGEPGLHSSRWRGLHSADERNRHLLSLLKGKSEKERTAYFICVIAFLLPSKFGFFVEGKVYGKICEERRGKKGFGYDPIFFYPPYQKTFAEISEEEKSKVSHRGLAFQNFIKGLNTLMMWRTQTSENF